MPREIVIYVIKYVAAQILFHSIYSIVKVKDRAVTCHVCSGVCTHVYVYVFICMYLFI